MVERQRGAGQRGLCSRRTLTSLLLFSILALLLCLYGLYQVRRRPWPGGGAASTHSTKDDYPRRKAGQIAQYTFHEDFHPINERGVYSFWNVCIEAIQGDPALKVRLFPNQKVFFNETKRLVVYDSFFRSGQQSLVTSASINAVESRWDVFFSHDPIPKTHSWTSDTAYFISQSCPANFHHFWNDEFLMLFSVMNMTNRLRAQSKNHVIYRSPWNLDPAEAGCDDVHRYDFFLKSLHVQDPHDVFFNMPDNMCFRNGVFGLANLNYDSKRAVQFMLRHAGITPEQCASADRVVIIQRLNRRILNVNDLQEAAQKQGFHDVQVVTLEEMSVEQQLATVACSSVMVGVQGAGLQWAIFMPAGSTLIEIAWPQKFWGFYFADWVSAYGIDHKKLVARHVHVNWPVYESILRKGVKVPREEREELLKSQPKSATLDNIWKWADVVVEPSDFSQVLDTTKVPEGKV